MAVDALVFSRLRLWLGEKGPRMKLGMLFWRYEL
jgi:hypothetical protein